MHSGPFGLAGPFPGLLGPRLRARRIQCRCLTGLHDLSFLVEILECRMRGHSLSKGGRGKACSATRLAPKSSALPQGVIERDGLQRVLHSRSYLHPRMTVPQQGAQVPLLGRGHPDRGKARSKISRASRRSCFCFRVSAARIFAGWPTRHSIPNSSSSSKNHRIDPVASMPTTTGPSKAA
jgi:hypothetical protein